jgi:alpha-1,2-mannosyltransferase
MAFLPSRSQRIGLAIFLVAYVIAGVFTTARQLTKLPLSDSLFMDFGFYDAALQRVRSGGDMYAKRDVGEAYLYPPPALLSVELTSFLPGKWLRGSLFAMLDVAMACAMIFWVARRYSLPIKDVWYWFPLTLGFAPFLVTMFFGQINMLTQFGLALMLIYETSLPWLSGLGLGLAVMTKVTPLLFGLYLLVTRNFKVILWTVVALIGLALLAGLRYGFQPFLTYVDVFRGMTSVLPVGYNGQSLAARLLPFVDVIPGLVQFGLGLYLFVVVTLTAWMTFRSGKPKETFFIVSMLAMMLYPNILWYHHYVFFLLPLLVWMGWQRDNQWVTFWCLGGMLLIQLDYFLLSGGLLIHIFGHLSILAMIFQPYGVHQLADGRVKV